MKNLILLSIVLALSACGIPVDGQRMSINSNVLEQIEPNPLLKGKVKLGNIDAAKNLGNSGVAITAEAFSIGLRNSLMITGYHTLGSAEPTYLLNANVTEASLPELGLDIELNTVVEYELVSVKDQSSVWKDTVKIPYVEPFGSSFNAQARMEMAAANGMRENITHLIRVLSTIDLPK